MRKITSKKDNEKKQRRNRIIVSVVLIFVMFFSVLGSGYYLFSDKEETNKLVYNGYEFVEQNGLLFVQMGEYQFVFKNNPKELPKIGYGIKTLNNYKSKPLYIYSESEEATWSVSINLNSIVQRMQSACFDENCESDVPIKTCEDNFIIIRESEYNKIEQDENCVFIEGKSEDLQKLTDEFLLKVIGVD